MNKHTLVEQTFELTFPHIRLSCLQIGEGSRVLLCFHGYRQSKELFRTLSTALPKDYQLLALDQPLHGETKVLDSQMRYDKRFLAELSSRLMQLLPDKKWSVMGFSMGAKAAMMIDMAQVLALESILLLAPAGVITHPINRFFSYHWAGRRLFRFLLNYPSPVLHLNTFAHRQGWSPKFSYRFVKAHFEKQTDREYLLRFSPVYERFHFDFEQYVSHQRLHPKPIALFWGTDDYVLPFAQSRVFTNQIPHTTFFPLPNASHNLLEENAHSIVPWVRDWLSGEKRADTQRDEAN